MSTRTPAGRSLTLFGAAVESFAGTRDPSRCQPSTSRSPGRSTPERGALGQVKPDLAPRAGDPAGDV